MKKWIASLLIIFMIAVVTACGDQNSSGDGETELTIWVAGNSNQIQDTFRAIIDDFNEQHESEGIKANIQFEPWGELDQKLSTSLAGGVGPDVFMHGAAAAAGFAAGNQIEPLNAYFDDWADFSEFNPGYLEAGSVEGDYYVIPIQGANRMMFYREDIFREAGVEVPETLDELLEISEAFVEKDGSRFVRAATNLPTEGNDLQQIWSAFLWSNGGDILSEDYTEAAINSEEAIKAIEFYKGFFDRELTPIAGMGGQGDQHPLGTGEVAFTFDGVWAIEQIQTYTPDAYEHVRVTAPPRGLDGTTTLVGSSGFFMNANSDHKDAAWKLMSFIGDKDNIEKVASELKFLPVRLDVADADFVQEDRLFAEFVELTTKVNGKANPNVPRWTAIRDIVVANVEKAIYGQLTPEEAVENAEKEINEEINRN
ncbi:ABC transporter substrate-binding protein [Evansella sp. AB-rgal1]|uniref:ABC transporter substrate-binding protein n=1 Tax=Evansella sp. AB-rgal1 TaxID=3242696 RepID=UPI00359EB708